MCSSSATVKRSCIALAARSRSTRRGGRVVSSMAQCSIMMSQTARRNVGRRSRSSDRCCSSTAVVVVLLWQTVVFSIASASTARSMSRPDTYSAYVHPWHR
ncbi:hypothetical protein NESM_000686600 [Novymonas esmeraldas]|uniref:Uncharacterized protein n=1 Tax=Novymonas esmeraldas TaxID=1808958 RepID=A0AAW0ET41_9TRYP